MKINIAILDDDEKVLNNYNEVINNLDSNNNFKTDLFSKERTFFHKAISDINFYHILILDINLGQKNGIETAKELRNKGYMNEIIFITNYVDYAFDAFDAYPFHYLLKETTSESEFSSILLKAVNTQIEKQSDIFRATSKGKTILIPYHKIEYFEVIGRYITVFYDNKSFKFIDTITHLEQKLPQKKFARVHRSYIINMRFIDSFQEEYLFLRNGKLIPLGKTRIQETKKLFSEFLSLS
ncbi:Two-component system, LytTr DNA-binding region [Alteracholeplasma palmae J233]|uniref:Two-component system, LytTr DNA-binding region n=1 Tax=Alteracholeplasma palmae (strain ATCC 49389 / J233) TaxID=1318466 RepID=U4KQN3_ALTPJ|nr:response regulator transcription factor [Alteracholeplasma palmae]CCV64880.1 Two-component system, LytTr DNA-binding region [Alteracholeplasma palmae J233]